MSPSQKRLMGFLSFGGLYFCFGGLAPPKPMPGYVPEPVAITFLLPVDSIYIVFFTD